MPIDALSVLCAQMSRDLLATAKFLFETLTVKSILLLWKPHSCF